MLRVEVCRLGNVYGPRQDPSGEAGVVPIFCSRVLAGKRPIIYGDGRQTRDYVYVGDAVAAFLAAADCGKPGTWNIGTGREVSVLELAGIIGRVSGRPVEPEFSPPRPGELEPALSRQLARRDSAGAPPPRSPTAQAVYRWIGKRTTARVMTSRARWPIGYSWMPGPAQATAGAGAFPASIRPRGVWCMRAPIRLRLRAAKLASAWKAATEAHALMGHWV